MANRIIDQLTPDQRYMILSEILEDLNEDESMLIRQHVAPGIAGQMATDAEHIRVAQEIAAKRNNPGVSAGVETKKLI